MECDSISEIESLGIWARSIHKLSIKIKFINTFLNLSISLTKTKLAWSLIQRLDPVVSNEILMTSDRGPIISLDKQRARLVTIPRPFPFQWSFHFTHMWPTTETSEWAISSEWCDITMHPKCNCVRHSIRSNVFMNVLGLHAVHS